MTDSMDEIPPPPTQPRKPTRPISPNSSLLRQLAEEDADVIFIDSDFEDSKSDLVDDATGNIDVDDSDGTFEQPTIKRELEDVHMEDLRAGAKKKGSRTTSSVFFLNCVAAGLLTFSCRRLSQLLTLRCLLQRR